MKKQDKKVRRMISERCTALRSVGLNAKLVSFWRNPVRNQAWGFTLAATLPCGTATEFAYVAEVVGGKMELSAI